MRSRNCTKPELYRAVQSMIMDDLSDQKPPAPQPSVKDEWDFSAKAVTARKDARIFTAVGFAFCGLGTGVAILTSHFNTDFDLAGIFLILVGVCFFGYGAFKFS